MQIAAFPEVSKGSSCSNSNNKWIVLDIIRDNASMKNSIQIY